LSSIPNINRGTLILLEPNAQDATTSSKNPFFVFQYNPEKLVHTFNQATPSTTSANNSDSQVLPEEFFNLIFELDSVDMDSSLKNQVSTDLGVHPALTILELMMQPQIAGKQKSMPIVIFKWGAKRILPVHLVSMSIEEKSFDVTLNPTRAMVTLTLKVLTAAEITNNPGAQKVLVSHENMRTTLVDAYKVQTGQAPLIAGSDNSKLAGSVTAASAGTSKQKISA